MSQTRPQPSEQEVWEELRKITDPEIPVLSLVELMIVRDVQLDGTTAAVVISPTFVGCPALEHMKNEIRQRLTALGFTRVEISLTFDPPWTTDMLTESTREKLTAFGIAPPVPRQESVAATMSIRVHCPFCKSDNTQLENAFGATLCKQLYYCNECRQSFERIKTV